MSYKRIGVAGLIPVGLQVISLTNSTAVAINGTVRPSTFLRISVETNDVRYRDDGTAPTLTTGLLLQSDAVYEFSGFNNTSLLKFQRATGSATVTIAGYRHPGDPTTIG